jgi:ribosomal protein S18 acetylase RimI-like enzyme
MTRSRKGSIRGEPLYFAPINLGEHAALCVRFRLDSYVCSFGSSARFYADNNTDQGYIDWLQRRMRELSGSCVHLWRGTQIIGQLELGRSCENSQIGYVNLCYLVPDARGSGVSSRLDEYLCEFHARLGLERAHLIVSPSNDRAIRFYEKYCWKNRGDDPRYAELLLFEKTFTPAQCAR